MKKYKVIYEVKEIEQRGDSKLIRIVKDEKGKRFRIRVKIPTSSSNEIDCYYWNGNEFTFVCGKYDIQHDKISPYDRTKESLMMDAYDKIIKFIDCLED